jgi:S-formylglutathione hydrolase FrmB
MNMALQPVEGAPGPPWQRPLAGALDQLVVESELLSDNALGDPARRPLYVYRSPGAAQDRTPSIYLIQGFSGQLDAWLARDPFEPSNVERMDAMFASTDTPPATVVYVDAWTSLGGSQFLNSPATGRYMDYLCDEVVPFVDARYATRADRAHRGIAGKSSGGYGAMVVPMLRPDVFGALASHAGDSLFEVCCLPRFPAIARTLRDHFDGSYEVFFRGLAQAPQFDFDRFGEVLEMYAYASAYSPDPDNPRGPPRMPFELTTGRLVEDVWAQWLEHDPVRMVARHADALRTMRRIYLDAGRSDQAFLDLGAQAVSDELTRHRVEHTLELFDGRHDGISWRYPGAIRELVLALDAS